MTGVKWVHIPYKGGGLALQELIAGQTSLSFLNLPTAINIARAGKLRALATTGAKRAGAAPELPTVAESGVPGFEVTTMYGISAPAKTPRVIIDRLHGEIVRALNSPDIARQADRSRRRSGRQHAGGIHRVHQERNCEVGESDQRSRHPKAVLK